MTDVAQISTVRLANQSEENDLIQIAHELHAENGLFEMDDDMVRAMFRRAFNRQGGIIGVIGEPGHIEAVIFLLVSSFWYSKDAHLEEMFSFCRPEFRRSNHAKTLISFAKRCSDEIGIPLLIGIVSNCRTEAKVRLYRRQLSDPAGAFFWYAKKKVA